MGCMKSKGASVEPMQFAKQEGSIENYAPRSHTTVQESASWTAGMTSRHQQALGALPRWPADRRHEDRDGNQSTADPSQFFDSNCLGSESDTDIWRVTALSELFESGHPVDSDDETSAATDRLPIPFMAPTAGDEDDDVPEMAEKSKVVITSPFDASVRYVVDDPEESTYGVNAFPRGDQELGPDDTIWPGKREFMDSYSSVKSLDQHVLKAPVDLRFAPPQKIVKHLTRNAKDEFQKFRVLFRWVAHVIAYEFSFLAKSVRQDTSPLSILETGYADSSGISKLLQFLCSIAGLTCEVIVGYNKNIMPGRPPLRHSWNRIKLGGRWFLSDCAAALHSSASTCVPEKFREYEFLSEPQYFHSRRVPKPLDRYGEPIPYTSLQQFNRMPTFGAMASVCNIQCTSHTSGIILADATNSVRIDLKSCLPLMTWSTLTSSKNYKDHHEHIVQWWEGSILHIVVDLPFDGVWEFKVFGHVLCDMGKTRDPNALIPPTVIDTGHCHLVTFTIIGNKGQANPPRLAHDSGMCGIALTCEDFRCLSHASPFVEAENGKAVIAILMADYRVKIVYRLFRVDTSLMFITNQVYMERVGKTVLIHVFCEKPGRYALRLLVNKAGKSYSRQGEYLINDAGSNTSERAITFSQTLGFHVWGPNEHFAEHGMEVVSGHTTSTIVAIDGEVIFQMSWPTSEGLLLSCCLQDIKREDRLQSGRVIIDTRPIKKTGLSITTFHIRMKETGCFVLQVYARLKDATKNKRVGGWLIVVKRKSNKSRFPDEGLICGPNEIFAKMGMKTGLSKMESTDGKGRIDISYESECERSFRYDVTSASHNRYEDVVDVMTTVIRHSSLYVTSFHISLPVPNVYAIRIMTFGDANEWNSIGTWIVMYEKSKTSKTRAVVMGGRQSLSC